MKATFAFEEKTSPVSRISAAKIKTHEQAQYMGLCQFTNVFWEFDRDHNFAPTLVFEGDILRMDAIDTKFPHDIDSVYFSKNKPRVRYDYKFTDEQYAALASNGFWSEDGVHIPEVFTTSKFMLECDAVVKEVTQAYESQNIPIFNIAVSHPYENEFNITQYDIVDHIKREQPDEKKVIENSRTYQELTSETDIMSEVEAAKEALKQVQEQEQQAAYVLPDEKTLAIRNASNNVSNYVNSVRDSIQAKRDADNAMVAAEKARIKAEQEGNENVNNVPEKDKNIVEFDDNTVVKTDTDKLVEADTDDKYESNTDIFNGEKSDENEEIPDNIAAFMARLGGNSDIIIADDNKKTDNSSTSGSASDSGSGAASGAQGLGVYTFEDQNTAQFDMRADEGKGNEKSDDDKSDEQDTETDDKTNTVDTKSDVDMDYRRAQLNDVVRHSVNQDITDESGISK